MQRSLAIGTKLTLGETAPTVFRIDALAGKGGSCVAYRVTYQEENGTTHAGILKEYCPLYLEDAAVPERSGSGILVPPQYREAFAQGVTEFIDTYREINRYLLEHMEAVNYHPVPLGLYTGNGTVYSLSSLDYGQRYDRLDDGDLKSLLRVVLSITRAVAQYHEAGYLHLDIKPENIFILDGVTELVKLFDYDSLLPMEALRNREIRALPQPGVYYVPELADRNLRAIGIQTDIFEIGALLFLRLFGKAPTPADMERGAQYPWDRAKLPVGMSPQAKFELEKLLQGTLQVSPRRRFSSDDALMEQLKRVISLLRDEAPYLLNLPKWQPSACHLGRETEVKAVRTQLLKDGYVWIRGMGGIGKSELAKQYAKHYAADYHTVQFCKYNGSLQMLTAALPVSGIEDSDYRDFKKLAAEKNKVLHRCDAHTLLIVDNFNVTYDAYLREFLPAGSDGYHVIFTTRCVQAADYYAPMTLELPRLPLPACKRLFRYHYGSDLPAGDDADLETLLLRIERNTLMLTLMAKAMRRAGLTPAQMLERIEAQTMQGVQPQIFHEYDTDDAETEAYNKLYAHLNTVYRVTGLTAIEQEVLKSLTLISPEGLAVDAFVRHCADERITAAQVRDLAALGWVELDATGMLTMHQIVSDLLSANADLPPGGSYAPLFEALLEECDTEEAVHITLAMHRLTTAIHLNRRCRELCPDARIVTKLTLGRLYASLYRPKEARALLQEAEALDQTAEGYYAPLIHLQQGHVEAEFGLAREARALYAQVIVEGQSDLAEYGSAVLCAMLEIARMLAANNENRNALQAYDRAIAFAGEKGLEDLLDDAIEECIAICKELDDSRLLPHYQALRRQPEQKTEGASNFLLAIDGGQFTKAQREYAALLEECRAFYGEESPLYQSACTTQWIFSLLLHEEAQTFREINTALAFIAEHYGEGSAEMADQLSLMAFLLPELEEVDYAIDAAQRAMQILETLQNTERYAYTKAKLALANAHLLRSDPDAAGAIMDTIDFTSFDGNAYYSDLLKSAGFVLCETSRYEALQTLCEKVLGRSTMDRNSKLCAHILLAIMSEQRGDLTEAQSQLSVVSAGLDAFEQSHIKQDWLVAFRRCAARIAYRRGDFAAAVRELTVLLDTHPDPDALILQRAYAERGLFYFRLGEAEKAASDYAHAERLLTKHHMPVQAFLLLYNNIAVQYTGNKDPENAKLYLQKIQAARPQVLQPETYYDAIVCQNIGWTEALCRNYSAAQTLLERAIDAFEALGMEKNTDYWLAKKNLALVFLEQGNCRDAILVYQQMVSGLQQCETELQTPFRTETVATLLSLLYREERVEEARDLTDEAVDWFCRQYGSHSGERMELMLRMLDICIAVGDRACAHWLLRLAQEEIEEGGFTETLYHATLLNYIAVFQTDLLQAHRSALQSLQRAKQLCEALGATDQTVYSWVLQNIDYVKSLL